MNSPKYADVQVKPRSVRAPFQSIDCQSLVALTDAVSGWIRSRKALKMKKWTNTFTVLYKGHVYTYKHETSSKQSSLFSLYGYISSTEKKGHVCFFRRQIVSLNERVERDLEIDEKEQLWVIKIIPAPGSANKSKHFALPSEKDLHMWAERFLKELHLANDEAYARSISSDIQMSLHKSQSDYYMYDDVSHYTSCTDLDEDMRHLSAPACITSTHSLPALYAITKTSPQKDCFFSSSNVYEDRRNLKGPPIPPRQKGVKKIQQCDIRSETDIDDHDSVNFNLHDDASSDDDESQFNIVDSVTVGYENSCINQEGYGTYDSLFHSSRDESINPYDHLHSSSTYTMYTDAASVPPLIQRKERKESIYAHIGKVSRKGRIMSEHLIPPELLEKNEKAVEMYKDCLKLGKERRNKIRIIVVGPKKSGKTCLVRKLLRQGIEDVNSTNGVEIHISKCKAQISDNKWTCEKETSVEEDVNSRLLKSIINTYKEIKNNKSGKSEENNEENIDDDVSDDSLFSIESDKWTPSYDTVESTCTIDSPCSDYQNISEDMHDLCEILKAPLDLDDFASIDFWDFAGDKEYYNTHKAFLSKDAIYIVTFDVSKTTQDLSVEESRYDLKFWLETIRCYGTDRVSDEDESHKDPSVFIVGTHRDKFKGNLQQCRDSLVAEVEKAVENEETRKHVRNYYLVSNTEDTDDDFDKMRQQLLSTAQTTTSWNESRPVRWIHLEKSLLDEINSGQFILSKDEILQIAANTNQPISDPDEVEAFLIHHHGIGTYTYFKDLPDYVVLFPQWLANAFRCIVFADMFQSDISIITEWNQFRTTGRLSVTLLGHLFSMQSSDIKEHRDHILAVMEKFDIIVRPKIKLESNEIVQESNYYVPCMIRTKDLNDVIGLLKCESKSSWLCLEFDFLPPPLTTSLLVAYSRELTVASVANSAGDNEPVFYSNFALFYPKDAEDEMLLIAAYKNILQMQVWKWGHTQQCYSGLRKELAAFLKRLCSLFQMKLCYKTKLKCSASTLACNAGMEDIDQFEEKQRYFCKMHSEFHFTDDMSADWIGIVSKQTLTKEQINASRMSIITLGVLTDALYDRLTLDSPPVRSRTKCDISYLYAELRRNNRQVPSKGFWGGSLKDINETDKKIGDDIERIRLIRNEIQHLSSFAIDNSRFKELCRLVRNVAKRMELNNNKSTDYTNGVRDILQRDISHKELQEQEKGIHYGCPRIKIKKKSQQVNIGASCTIECEVLTSLPADSVVIWSKGTEPSCETNLSKTNVWNSKYGGSSWEFPSLNIYNVDMSDEGYYSCKIQYPEDSAEFDDINLNWPITYLHVLKK